MEDKTNIYSYIIKEEANYKTLRVPIVDGYEWNMYEHIQKSTLYKNSKFASGKDDGERPFKNIIRPILNVAYRSEGFDVKDIQPFVDDAEDYYLSFLVRKFHNRWARKNDLDTFIDGMVENYVDYGGALVKNVGNKYPENVPWQRIAFCDQTDILSGVICEKHQYSPDELLDMKWDKDKIDEAIDMARAEKSVAQAHDQKAKTPGKYIAVYELHGMMPTDWLVDKYQADDLALEQMSGHDYTRQAQYVTFWTDEKGVKHGITLFKTREKKRIYKLKLRDGIFGRALGFGGIEELFEAQVWTNYSAIQIKEMLDIASLILLQTADPAYATKNKITDLEKGTIMTHEPNAPLSQVNIQPINIEAFNKAVADWELHARTTGSANDAQLGIDPDSGTPFALQNLVTQTGQDLHKHRQGILATFMGELYRDWILQYLVNDMNQGDKWLDELSLEEMQTIAETVATCEANDKAREIVLSGKMMNQANYDLYKSAVMDSFMKGGNKKFLEIVKGELKEIPIEVDVNIAGKQRDLSKITAGLTNIFRQIFANPQGFQATMQIPGMAKTFNEIIEYSGLSPVDFSGIDRAPAQAQPDASASNGEKKALPLATSVA